MAPRNVGKIDHVAAMFWNTENQEKARKQLESALGITDFEEVPDPTGLWIRFLISWDSGIELAAPIGSLPQSSRMFQKLKERGEGWHSVMFGVADLTEAEKRAKAAGLSILQRFDTSMNHSKFDVVIETGLGGLTPISITLGQFEPQECEGQA
jgi:hypothetical protein